MLFGYLMGIMAGVDPAGRVASLSFSVQTVCFGLGPAWGGMLATHEGYPAILWTAGFSVPLSLLFLLPLAHAQDKMRRPAADSMTSGTVVRTS